MLDRRTPPSTSREQASRSGEGERRLRRQGGAQLALTTRRPQAPQALQPVTAQEQLLKEGRATTTEGGKSGVLLTPFQPTTLAGPLTAGDAAGYRCSKRKPDQG